MKKGSCGEKMKNMSHKEHVHAMRCHFKDIMKDSVKTLDNLRFHMEESIVSHDLLPGKMVQETPEMVIVSVLLPGIKKENLDLNLTESQLEIKATINMENEMKGNLISFHDKREGIFRRKISLPTKVVPQEAKAQLDDGILRLEVPKLEKEEQFKVKIE